MTGDCHARFRGSPGVRSPRATRPLVSANDMEAVDRQLEAAREFEAKIDSDVGGPGQGWYGIVESPGDARQVMSERGNLRLC